MDGRRVTNTLKPGLSPLVASEPTLPSFIIGLLLPAPCEQSPRGVRGRQTAPEELVGRKIIVVSNLQPRTLRGLESRGMLLAADAADGRPVLATVPAETPNGARLH